MRPMLSILILAVMVLVTSAANAITFSASLSSASPGPVGFDDLLTLDITVVLDAGDEINALGASVYGYGSGVLSFVSGTAVNELFFQNAPLNPDPNAPICTPYPFICQPSGPITNSRGGALVEGTASVGTGFGGQPEVEIIAAIDLFNTYVPQAFSDPGLDGNPGTVQFQLFFEFAGPGVTTLFIGAGSDLDGVSGGPSPGTVNTILIESPFPTPEPSTVLLIGLGLAGLAAVGRGRA